MTYMCMYGHMITVMQNNADNDDSNLHLWTVLCPVGVKNIIIYTVHVLRTKLAPKIMNVYILGDTKNVCFAPTV